MPGPFLPKCTKSSVGGNRIQIEKRRLRGIALFPDDHANTDQLRFIRKHLDEPTVGDLHELLVIPLPQFHFLFPEPVQPDHQRPDALLDQEINDATACRVQIRIDAAIALRRDPIQLAGAFPVELG